MNSSRVKAYWGLASVQGKLWKGWEMLVDNPKIGEDDRLISGFIHAIDCQKNYRTKEQRPINQNDQLKTKLHVQQP